MDFTKQVNYRSDFSVLLHVVDINDKAVGFPDFDFLFTFTTNGGAKVEGGKQGEIQRNVKDVNGDIMVIFDNHKLMPGVLNLEVQTNVPDEIYPDGKKKTVFKVPTNISLVNGEGDTGINLTIEVKLPFEYAKDSSSSSEEPETSSSSEESDSSSSEGNGD